MPSLRVLEISGSHYEMGRQHGEAYTHDIREIADERLRLSMDETWTGRSLSCERVLQLAQECVPYHEEYAPELMEQLQGIADATDLSIPELIIANGFTDFADVIYNAYESDPQLPIYGNECTAMLTSDVMSAGGKGFIAQTWDMHATATPYVILLSGNPDNEPDFLAFTLTGCVAMIGMNEAGIAVGINNLASADGAPGVTWPFVCRKILQQTNIDDALKCITEAKLAGGHSYMLRDGEGNGYNVEASTTAYHVKPLQDDALVHANMCLFDETLATERPLTDDLVEDSVKRLNRASTLLKVNKQLTAQDIMDVTRNRDDGSYSVCAMSEPPFYSETCGAVIMRPGTLEFWGVWGLPTQNDYEKYTFASMRELLSQTA